MKRRAAALQKIAEVVVEEEGSQQQEDASFLEEEDENGAPEEDSAAGESNNHVARAIDEEGEDDGDNEGTEKMNGDAAGDDESLSEQPINPALIPSKKKQHKPGVCYLSRLPPHMTPQQLRDILNYQGHVTRVYATPEPEYIRKKRKQKGGNNKMNYTEAWVEFERRSVAKRVAGALNNTQIGGPRRAFYHDDLWNIKYLKKFTWHHLTEKMYRAHTLFKRYEKRVREQKLRSEVALAKRETNAYLEQVQKAKTAKKIEERKQLKAQKEQEKGQGGKAKVASSKKPRTEDKKPRSALPNVLAAVAKSSK